MSEQQLLKEEEEESSQIEEPKRNSAPPDDIVVLNEQRSCADILRLKQRGHIEISPDFQRSEVWASANKTRFIDSLTKEIPIPSMCIGFDYKTDKRIVIDGLQRISTIIKFLTEDDWRLSSLDDIDEKLSGKTVGTIKREAPSIYNRVENLTLPITVLRCDLNRDDHMEYIYNIFYRLNTGGQKLNAQEIRNCIYIGPFNDLLHDLRRLPQFSNLLKLSDTEYYRFKWEENILRFFAFFYNLNSYEGRLAPFLNDYMKDHRKLTPEDLADKRNLFIRTFNFLYEHRESIEIPTSRTGQESLFIGVAKNLDTLSSRSKTEIETKYNEFKRQIIESANIQEGTMKKQKVIDRLTDAIRIFQ